jgi:hypothetical protein
MVQLATHLLHMQTQLMSACSWLPFFLPSYALRYPALVATCAFISFIVHILHRSLDFGTSRLEHYTHGTGVWAFNIIFCCTEHQYQDIPLLHAQIPYRIVHICQTRLRHMRATRFYKTSSSISSRSHKILRHINSAYEAKTLF